VHYLVKLGKEANESGEQRVGRGKGRRSEKRRTKRKEKKLSPRGKNDAVITIFQKLTEFFGTQKNIQKWLEILGDVRSAIDNFFPFFPIIFFFFFFWFGFCVIWIHLCSLCSNKPPSIFILSFIPVKFCFLPFPHPSSHTKKKKVVFSIIR